MIAYLWRDPQRCLDVLAAVKEKGDVEHNWLITFWAEMAKAALALCEQAQDALQEAITQGMPPISLLPMRWLRATAPYDFATYLEPVLLANHISMDQMG